MNKATTNTEISDALAKPLRVGINAKLISGHSGGVEQAIIGLATGLSGLRDGDERYSFLTIPGHDDWLQPYISGPCDIVHPSGLRAAYSLPRRTVELVRQHQPGLVRLMRQARDYLSSPRQFSHTTTSGGTLEALGARLIHFPYQTAFRTTVPTLYQPWDLQHEHLPEFFSDSVRSDRRSMYRFYCEQASIVVVSSQWVKSDLISQYNVDPNKIAVVPMAPPTDAYPVPSHEEIENTRLKLELPKEFLLYPAQTFAHKNHIGLIRALAALKADRGAEIPVVFSGRKNEFFPEIEQFARSAGIWNQLRFVGFVTPVELQCLYRMSRALIFPSKFEGWGLPVTEALQNGTPVACSNVTSLPEQVGDAAILFDPDSSPSIQEALMTIWTDHKLRFVLAERGRSRVSRYSWDNVAKDMRTLYRYVAACKLTESDGGRLERMLRIGNE